MHFKSQTEAKTQSGVEKERDERARRDRKRVMERGIERGREE